MILHRRAGEPEKAEIALDTFYEKYGRSGFMQLMRVTKQLMGDSRVIGDFNERLAKKAKTDVDIDIEASISETVAESCDPELTSILRRADAEGVAFGCIENCLWVYVCAPTATRQEAITEFSRRVFDASPETKAWLVEKTGRDKLKPVASVDQWAFVPTALPIFLRLLEPDDIVGMLLDELRGRVLLFFDWLRFEPVVARTGCALMWVRPEPIDGKNLHEIIGRKTPRIGHRSGRGLRLGKMFVSQFFADGSRPSSIAAQCAQMLERTLPLKDSQPLHLHLLWTGCPWFLRALRNPTTRLEDTRLGRRHAEYRAGSHRACQRLVLARREAAGERRGVIVRSTTACRWRSHLADIKYWEWAAMQTTALASFVVPADGAED